MKKTYFSPVSRFVDLSIETSCLGPSSIPVVPGEEVDDPNDVATKNQSIWGWTNDDN